MDYRKVRAGSLYRFEPVPIDYLHPPHNVKPNDIVRVVNLHGCPRANTMGHAHVQHLGGEFAGLVCVNSLIPLSAEEKKLVKRTVMIPTRARHSKSTRPRHDTGRKDYQG